MNPATQTMVRADSSETEARLTVRTRRFLLATNALGCESDLARSRLLGIDPKTISLACRGATVGGTFVAKTITTMRKHRAELAEVGIDATIDSFFEVTEDAS